MTRKSARPASARAPAKAAPTPDAHAAALHDGVNDPLLDPALYLNRELSQLDFNFRVLAQALDESVPLLERLKYLCISCTNLDEFFEIRAATVRHAQDFGTPLPPDGMTATTVLKRIHDRAAELVDAQYACWNQVMRPSLGAAGVRILGRDTWTARQTRWLRAYFREEVMPVLSVEIPVIETERLILRSPVDADRPALHAIWADPVTMADLDVARLDLPAIADGVDLGSLYELAEELAHQGVR